MSLKATVEEQIDVILKLQDQRKALAKQNKVYKQKNKQLTLLLNKYNFKSNTETSTYQTQTQTQAPQTIPTIQVFTQTDKLSPELNTSQLDEAKQLLNCLNRTQIKISLDKQKSFLKQKQKLEQSSCLPLETTSITRKLPNTNTNQQLLSSQLVKMTKQISSLKKDLKDSLKIIKTKQQQSKELKKCLDLKSELLQKARTDFNDLSKLVNTDKYKSIKVLEQESTKCREGLKVMTEENKVLKYEQEKMYGLNDKLRGSLEKLAGEYESWKEASEKEKEQQGERMATMKVLMDKYKEQAREYEKNEKHLLESIRKCQCKQK